MGANFFSWASDTYVMPEVVALWSQQRRAENDGQSKSRSERTPRLRVPKCPSIKREASGPLPYRRIAGDRRVAFRVRDASA